jgi:hypothetical protein
MPEGKRFRDQMLEDIWSKPEFKEEYVRFAAQAELLMGEPSATFNGKALSYLTVLVPDALRGFCVFLLLMLRQFETQCPIVPMVETAFFYDKRLNDLATDPDSKDLWEETLDEIKLLVGVEEKTFTDLVFVYLDNQEGDQLKIFAYILLLLLRRCGQVAMAGGGEYKN